MCRTVALSMDDDALSDHPESAAGVQVDTRRRDAGVPAWSVDELFSAGSVQTHGRLFSKEELRRFR